MKAREARKNQVHTVIKEMKLRPKIDPHDYETKKGHVVRFLKAGDKVKITIMFRGREQSRPELGLPAAAAARGGRRGARLRRVLAQAGRPQHDHGARPAQEEGRGHGRGEGRHARPAKRPASRRAPVTRPEPRPSTPRRRTRPTSASAVEHRRTSRAHARTRGADMTHRDQRHDDEENGAMPKMKTHSGAKKRFR